MRLNYLVVLEIIRTHKQDDCCNSLQIYYYSIFEIAYYFQVHHQPSPKNKFQIFFKDIIRGLALSMNSEEFSYLSSFKSLQQQSGLLPCLDDYFSPSSPTFTTTIHCWQKDYRSCKNGLQQEVVDCSSTVLQSLGLANLDTIRENPIHYGEEYMKLKEKVIVIFAYQIITKKFFCEIMFLKKDCQNT